MKNKIEHTQGEAPKMVIRKLEDFKNVPVGTEIYRSSATDLHSSYFAGFNPKNESYIMLINSGNISKMESPYIGDNEVEYYTDYDQARHRIYEKAQENVLSVKETWID